MAGHRSPGGRRADGLPAPHRAPVRHAAKHAAASGRGSVRRGVASTTAVFGAVGVLSTGAFAAVTSAPAPPAADAAEADATLVAQTSALQERAVDAAANLGGAHLSPVGFTVDDLAPFTDTPGEETVDGASVADLHLASLDKADVLAQQKAKEAAAQADRERLDAIIARGGLDGWIAEALRVCGLPQSLAPSVKNIILKESGGNPRAVNNWDSNARRGTPSQGLMQTIPSTFAKFVHPSLADRPITDPVANITAGVRYMIATYGIDTLEAGGRSNHLGEYIGY